MHQSLPMEREKRLLARMGPKLNGLRPRYGATSTTLSTLSPTDVAASVSLIRRPGPAGEFMPDWPKQRLILYIWAGHNSTTDVDKVLAGLMLEATKHVTWRPQPGELQRLAALALLEHIWPTPCRTCSATGYVWASVAVQSRGGQMVQRKQESPCPACGGSGRRPWGRQRLAQMLEVSEHQWRRRWAKRYYRMQTMIRWMELRGLAQIRRALRAR